jgi:hypothetical protein
MKKISLCVNCGRNIYTNDLNLCKRCHQDVGVDFLRQQEPEEVVEEEPASLEDLGIEATEEETEEVAEEPEEELKEEKKE